MAAAAVWLDDQTLGRSKVSAAQMRVASLDTDGGTNMAGAATAIHRISGYSLDIFYGMRWDAFLARLLHTRGAIVHGEYRQIPINARGDREFVGRHSVYVKPRDATAVWVADSLNDGRIDMPSGKRAPNGWIAWHHDVLRRYAETFPNGMVVGFLRRTYLRPAYARVNVRTGPGRVFAIRRTIGPTVILRHGGAVIGENVGGDRRWYKVWDRNAPGWMHASVIHLVKES